MADQNIEEMVREIIIEHLTVDAEKVVGGASFVGDLGADSLDLVELIMAMEEKFGHDIPDAVAEKLKTVQDAISYIKEKSN